MGTCATSRTQPCARARRCPPCLGFTSFETLVTLGIAGLLSLAGLATVEFNSIGLSMAQQELQGCLDQAFVQARAQGRNVILAAARDGGGPGIIPVHLPRRVKWGKPANIPLPPGMDDPSRADTVGQAHLRITVTPRRTVTASAWFLNDGKDALCFRLSGHGRLHVLRFRALNRRWERVG
jgi:hypothetical protein